MPPQCHDNRLVAKTNPKDGNIGCHLRDDITANSRLSGRAGARGQNDRRRIKLPDILHRDGIVTAHHRLLPELPEISGQVMHEAVVIIDD